MTTTTLKNNAFALNRAIEISEHCRPGSVIVRDGHHAGTLFTWVGREWIAYDLENHELRGRADRLAVVTLDSLDPDAADNGGLNRAALGVDLKVAGGELVIDAGDLDELVETYGDDLVVVWSQPS